MLELYNQNDIGRWPEMKQALAEVFKSKTRQQWCDIFEGSDACVSPVLALGEAPSDAHNASRGIFCTDGPDDGIWVEASPALSRTPARRASDSWRASDDPEMAASALLEAWPSKL